MPDADLPWSGEALKDQMCCQPSDAMPSTTAKDEELGRVAGDDMEGMAVRIGPIERKARIAVTAVHAYLDRLVFAAIVDAKLKQVRANWLLFQRDCDYVDQRYAVCHEWSSPQTGSIPDAPR